MEKIKFNLNKDIFWNPDSLRTLEDFVNNLSAQLSDLQKRDKQVRLALTYLASELQPELSDARYREIYFGIDELLNSTKVKLFCLNCGEEMKDIAGNSPPWNCSKCGQQHHEFKLPLTK